MDSFIKVCARKIKVEGQLLRIARIDGEKYRFLDDPEPVIKGLEKCGSRIDLFTFVQKLSDTEPQYQYRLEWDNFAALPITTFDHWWNKQIGFKARNKAKQAQKHGVVVREIPFDERLVEGIWQIYNETPIRQGKRFPHYGMSVARIREYAATFLDQSVFIGAFLETRLIGFIKLTMDETRSQAGLMHILSLISQRDKAPTNALVAQAVQSCAERSIRHLVYSNFAYGKKQQDGLADFKERNGFQQINVPRYYVPLSRLGRVALSFGLHHRLIDHVPEFLMARARSLRSAWYGRRHHLSSEAS